MTVSRYLRVAMLAFAFVLVGSEHLTAQDLPAKSGVVQDLPAYRGVVIENPPVRRRQPRQPRATPGKPSPPRINEALEEALAIGNAARDANPPRFPDAERGYRLALRLAPRDSRPSIGLGNIFLLQDRYADAVTNYSRALQLNPAERNVPAALAISYALIGRLDEAEQTARRAIERYRNDSGNYTALGLTMYLRNNLPEAEKSYRRAFELDPRNPLLPYQVGEVLRAQNRYADAVPFYRQSLSLINPQEQTYQPSILAAFGSTLLRLGQLDEAAKQYARIIQLVPDSPVASTVHSNLGLIYYAKGDFAQARKSWQEAVRLNTTYAPARIGLLILNGKLKEALAQLEVYTKTSSGDVDGWLMLGDVRRTLGDEEAARVAYVRAGQLVPEYAVLPRPSLQSLIAPVAQPPTPVRETVAQDGALLNSRALRLPAPSYPREARARGISGEVRVQIVVDEKGRVASARAVSGPAELHQAAVKAALQARFAPMPNGSNNPVRLSGTLSYNFTPQ